MSVGGNPSLIIDTLVNTAALGTGLRQAEAQVAQSASTMTRQMDRFTNAWGGAAESMLLRFAGPAFAIAAADKFARAFADGLAKNRTIFSSVESAYFSALEGLPVVGAGYSIIRSKLPTVQGVGAAELGLRRLLFGERPVTQESGGGIMRSEEGGLIGRLGIEDFLESIIPGGLGTVRRGGISPVTDPRMAESRVAFLQEQLRKVTPQPTRSELLSEQLSRQMGGAMGQAQTALGTFKFAQMGADSQAEIAKSVSKQVDLMMQIRDATEELRKLTASN